ncbi:MAG: hypothetical protein KZQ99_00065 [Candidatus Thiodiazotropha sp. (ex Dulcina madagascariensis)]|nr:hypothetical protein [Candidatus Thiodiazotropha sp. (ex Dulcina madagascariensis)]
MLDKNRVLAVAIKLVSTGPKLKLALVISLGLHALMIGLAANYSQTGFQPLPTTSLPKTIQITIAPPITSQTDTVTPSDPPLPADPKKMAQPLQRIQPTQEREKQTHRQASADDETVTHPPGETGRQTAPNSAHRPISTAKIMATATDVARKMAGEAASGAAKDSDSTSSKLDKALNKPREAPGVSMLSDGTTRVVTEYGIAYCIKPKDDLRINRPEDDLSVSMFCK